MQLSFDLFLPKELALQIIRLRLSLSLLLLKESPFLCRELARHETWLKLLLSPLLIGENLFCSKNIAPFWTWLGLKFSILLARELGQATTYSLFPWEVIFVGQLVWKSCLEIYIFIHEKKITKKIQTSKPWTFGLKGRDFNHYIILVLENIVQEKYLKHES